MREQRGRDCCKRARAALTTRPPAASPVGWLLRRRAHLYCCDAEAPDVCCRAVAALAALYDLGRHPVGRANKRVPPAASKATSAARLVSKRHGGAWAAAEAAPGRLPCPARLACPCPRPLAPVSLPPVPQRAAERAADAKVAHLDGAVSRQQDVGGLDVPEQQARRDAGTDAACRPPKRAPRASARARLRPQAPACSWPPPCHARTPVQAARVVQVAEPAQHAREDEANHALIQRRQRQLSRKGQRARQQGASQRRAAATRIRRRVCGARVQQQSNATQRCMRVLPGCAARACACGAASPRPPRCRPGAP